MDSYSVQRESCNLRRIMIMEDGDTRLPPQTTLSVTFPLARCDPGATPIRIRCGRVRSWRSNPVLECFHGQGEPLRAASVRGAVRG